jgi:hypothetical protein
MALSPQIRHQMASNKTAATTNDHKFVIHFSHWSMEKLKVESRKLKAPGRKAETLKR